MWFDADRNKTLAAMRRLCEQVPQADLSRIPDRVTVFAPSSARCGLFAPFIYPPSPQAICGRFIYFAPRLESRSQEEVGSPYCPKRYDEKLGTLALTLAGRVSSRTRHLLPAMKRLPKNLRGTASAAARSARVANTPSNPWGDPPALPGRQQKFDISGSVLHHFCDCHATSRPVFHEVLAFASDRLRSGPFEGPATVKPPALPGDIYFPNRSYIMEMGATIGSGPDHSL
jgi:hypothetical protein